MLTPKENMDKAFAHEIPDWVPHLAHDAKNRVADYTIERPINWDGYDTWGIHWVPCPESLNITQPDHTQRPLLEEADLWEDLVKFPDLDKIDWTSYIEAVEQYDDRSIWPTHYVSLNGIFERTHLLLGFEEALVAYMTDTDTMAALCGAIADHKIRLFERIWEIAQPDILVMHDDWATAQAPFLPMDIFEKCLFPNMKRITKACRDMGYRHLLHHTCGHAEDLVPFILDNGFDGWNSAQPTVNDLPAVKEKYGDRCVISSGLDAQGIIGDPNSTEEELRRHVREHIDTLGESGGLVIDSTFAYSMNPKNEEIIHDEIMRYGPIYCEQQKALAANKG